MDRCMMIHNRMFLASACYILHAQQTVINLPMS